MTIGARIVLVLFGLSLFGGIVTGSQFYYRIGYFWVFLFLGSWMWSLVALNGIRFQRRQRTLRAQVGQIYEERFELDNTSRLPRVLIAVRDDSPLPGSQGSRVFPIIERRRSRSYLVRTQLVKRGVFPLGPTFLESGDPFGLFPVRVLFESEESLLIYPMMANLRSFLMPLGVMPGGDAVRRRTPQITPNAAGVRDYAPGDPLNRIHWISTARHGRLIAKEFELDPQADVWIFLDASKDNQIGLSEELPIPEPQDLLKPAVKIKLPPSTEEYAVSVAATLSRYYLRQGRSVAFVSAGQNLTVIPPDRGGRQLGKILEALALIRAEGKLPLRALVRAQAQHLSRGSTVVLITPSIHQDVALAADQLLRRGQRPVVVLIDPETFGGPPGSDYLEATLILLNVPVKRIHNDTDLEIALSVP